MISIKAVIKVLIIRIIKISLKALTNVMKKKEITKETIEETINKKSNKKKDAKIPSISINKRIKNLFLFLNNYSYLR